MWTFICKEMGTRFKQLEHEVKEIEKGRQEKLDMAIS